MVKKSEEKKIIIIKQPTGMRKKRKRKGKGPGSTLGKTSGRGHKGQKSRSGSSMKPGFEGGQMPLHRRVPKRGFTNIFKKSFYLINLADLEKKAKTNDIFDIKRMNDTGLIKVGDSYKRKNRMIKILGDGDITKAVTVYTHKISRNAGDKIVRAGGKVFILSKKVKLNADIINLADEKIEKTEYKKVK